jgi:hypothetical protein
MTYEILQPVHLGKDELGQKRREALERLAAQADCFWNNQPSIGRWLIQIADYEIQRKEENKMSLREILEEIFDNGRVTSSSSQEELINEFEFSATENGWSDEEIKNAISSEWFPQLS